MLGVHAEPRPVVVEGNHQLAAGRGALLITREGLLTDRGDIEVARFVSELGGFLVFNDNEVHLGKIWLRPSPQWVQRELDPLFRNPVLDGVGTADGGEGSLKF